jgi:hypothetical protein
MASQEQLSAVLKALRFHDRSTREIEAIPENDWPALLHAMDRAHLTLALGVRCRDLLPESARLRIDRNLAGNRARHDCLVATHSRITDALSLTGIEYVVMKGLSQWPWYVDDPGERPQYDIDIFVPRESMSGAAKAIHTLGYGFVNGILDPGADHLPVMIRRTGWTWRDDYYDPEMPISLELHYRFWNPQMMRFDTGDVAQFWRRRVVRQVGKLRFPTLDPVDGLSYSALHLIRHFFGGDLRLRHVYEIAHFLERSACDDSFWTSWSETGLASCRVIEGIAFRLAKEWFRCNLHPVARETIEQLPSPIKRWFSLFAFSSIPGTGLAGKNELWLHFCLLNNARDRREIAFRRFFPKRAARVVRNPHVSPSQTGLGLRIRRVAYKASFMANRLLHHARTLGPTIHGAWLWWSAPRIPGHRKHWHGTARPGTGAATPFAPPPKAGP